MSEHTDEPSEAPAEPPNFALLLPFDTDDPEFARGFEAGRIWSFVQTIDFDEEDPGSLTIHSTNTEMVMRIAEASGYSTFCVVLDDTWIEVTFGEQDDQL